MPKEYLAHKRSMVDWSGDLALTNRHHQAALKEITVLLQARNPDLQHPDVLPDRDRELFEAAWRDIQDAVANYQAALWLANLPAEPRFDWRSGLRALKKQPDLPAFSVRCADRWPWNAKDRCPV